MDVHVCKTPRLAVYPFEVLDERAKRWPNTTHTEVKPWGEKSLDDTAKTARAVTSPCPPDSSLALDQFDERTASMPPPWIPLDELTMPRQMKLRVDFSRKVFVIVLTEDERRVDHFHKHILVGFPRRSS